jgi:hypothetical protein
VATDRDDSRLAAPGDLELVRDFVNTLDVPPGTDEIEDPPSLASWLTEHRLVPLLPTLTNEDLARARSLREALRALLLANAGFPLPAEAAEAFDAAVGSVCLRARTGEAAGWSRPSSLRRRMGPGLASKPAPSATGRSTITRATIRPPGAAPSAALGRALVVTGGDISKILRRIPRQARIGEACLCLVR